MGKIELNNDQVRHVWVCAECDAAVEVPPDSYQEVGNPVCASCEVEMVYNSTYFNSDKGDVVHGEKIKSLWATTVQLAVEADTEAAACDVISETLREVTHLGSPVVDWSYLKLGAYYTSPTHIGDYSADHVFEEGEVL